MIQQNFGDHVECESCLMAGEHTRATCISSSPKWSGYALCAECAAELDNDTDVCPDITPEATGSPT